MGSACLGRARRLDKLGAHGSDDFMLNQEAMTAMNQPSTLHMHATR